MKIVFLTPGTGHWYCGACMRDNALAKSLQSAGHTVSLLPMYLPLHLDDGVLEGSAGKPVFFGGINLYLQQKFAFFRHTPEWFDRLLDHPWLLRGMARRSHMTSARDLGEMTLSMLRFEDSGMDKEMEKLCVWLEQESPDVLCLSTALQAGMIRSLKSRLSAKIICCFQGEDSFLDGLADPWRDESWRELALRVAEADALVSPSGFYADLMAKRLGEGTPRITVISNGVDVSNFIPVEKNNCPPVIGYLARMSLQKGLDVMVDAFIHLRKEIGHSTARLHLAGAATEEDTPLIEMLRQRLAAAGLTGDVSWSPNLSREKKSAMLGSLSLFSVPAVYPEAFGLYLIEALATGVPLVQPDAASFPEIVGKSAAGMLVPSGDPVALAHAWHELLDQPEKRHQMAKQARAAAIEFYDVSVMRDGFVALASDMLASGN